MTKKELIRIEKELLSELPQFEVSGTVMFLPPLDKLLRGIGLQGSGLDRASFYTSVFIMPLCVPTDHLYFSFGKRLRHAGIESWNKTAPTLLTELGGAIKSEAIPFLSSINSLLDFAEMARAFNEKNPPTLRAIAYSLARAGENRRAIDVLDRLFVLCDLTVAWQRDLAQEAQSLKSKLIEDPAAAQRQLETWESETVRNLKLDTRISLM
jgi:hypothetical protein